MGKKGREIVLSIEKIVYHKSSRDLVEQHKEESKIWKQMSLHSLLLKPAVEIWPRLNLQFLNDTL